MEYLNTENPPIETESLHFIQLDRLKPDAIIVDGGCHTGQLIEELRRRTIMGEFHVIEPSPELVKIITAKQFPNVFIYEKALVGNKQDSVIFYDFGDAMRGNTKNLYAGYAKTYQVGCITLEELNLPVIDYLKLDVEGTEGEIFEQMSQETANKIKQISVEVHTNVDRTNLKERLGQLGFKVADPIAGHDVYGWRD